jgi:hypothetical protein
MGKIPKEILDAMKINAQDTVTFNDYAKSNDFAPKRKEKLTIKQRLKKLTLRLFNKVKKSKILVKLKTWFNNTLVKPYQTKKAKREEEKYVKELKENFSKKFNVNIEKTISVMSGPGYSPANIDDNSLLIQNSLDINKRKTMYKFAPFMYNPEFVDIHNENLNPEYPSVTDIMTNGNIESLNLLKKQHEFFDKRPHLTVSFRKRSGKMY